MKAVRHQVFAPRFTLLDSIKRPPDEVREHREQVWQRVWAPLAINVYRQIERDAS